MGSEHFPWVDETVAPQVAADSHVTNIQVAEIMFNAWMNYLRLGIGAQSRDVFAQDARPIVRAITAQFDAEVASEDVLRCGVRAVSRSRTAFTLEQVLWRLPDEQRVASGTVVLVTIDRATGQTTPIPDDLWSSIECAEGRRIEPLVKGG